MESTINIRCSHRQADYIFHSGCYDHPEVPLFGFAIKGISPIVDAGQIDINKPHQHEVKIRYPEKIKLKKEYTDILSFLLDFRRQYCCSDNECELQPQDKAKHHFERFLNGGLMSEEELTSSLAAYVMHEDKYESGQLSDGFGGIIAEREMWNNGIDEASLTDLDAEGRNYYAIGYQAGAAAVIAKVKEYLGLCRTLDIARDHMNCLATSDYLPSDRKQECMEDYWGTRRRICELQEEIEKREKYFKRNPE